jgi:major membrane immunogen (membrane-anchored lipoprotein)
MKQLSFALLLCMAVMNCRAQNTENEKVVKTFYSGFENHDWNTVASQLASDFTFSSAAGDDHISLAQFKEKCFPTNKFFKKANFVNWGEGGDKLFLLVEITTTDGKLIRNVDVYTFKDGKMESMQCFFGSGGGYPGNGK